MGTTVATEHSKEAGSPKHENDADWKLPVPVPIAVAGITVAGGFAIAGLVHWLTKRRDANTRFSQASKEIRSAFADELAYLESNKDPYFDIQAYLLAAYDTKHRAAIALFEGFIEDNVERERFKAAWHQYHSGQQAGGEPLDMFEMGSPYKEAMFIEYSGNPFRHPTMGARKLAIYRMRALLAFAKHN